MFFFPLNRLLSADTVPSADIAADFAERNILRIRFIIHLCDADRDSHDLVSGERLFRTRGFEILFAYRPCGRSGRRDRPLPVLAFSFLGTRELQRSSRTRTPTTGRLHSLSSVIWSSVARSIFLVSLRECYPPPHPPCSCILRICSRCSPYRNTAGRR